ncbi:MAG: PEP-utilizing enzyme, partial [Ilumatobacteraceae bacterium]
PAGIRDAVLVRFDTDHVRERFPELDLWLARCTVWMGIRERTKATCVLTINEQRLDAFEIGSRLVVDGRLARADDVYFLTLDELRAVVAGDDPDRTTVQTRRDAQAELERYVEPLFVIVGEMDPVREWPLADSGLHGGSHGRDGSDSDEVTEIVGAAGSPGRATGRARVIRDPYVDEPTEPGEVLIAPITDPGWMPLFIGAVAVVAEMGGELSHTMIVSRALGLPAVVGALGATRHIRTGDLVEVDGSTGVVRIIERA